MARKPWKIAAREFEFESKIFITAGHFERLSFFPESVRNWEQLLQFGADHPIEKIVECVIERLETFQSRHFFFTFAFPCWNFAPSFCCSRNCSFLFFLVLFQHLYKLLDFLLFKYEWLYVVMKLHRAVSCWEITRYGWGETTIDLLLRLRKVESPSYRLRHRKSAAC